MKKKRDDREKAYYASFKQKQLDEAHDVVGTCPDMCPEFERYDREVTQELHFFEAVSNSLSSHKLTIAVGWHGKRSSTSSRSFQSCKEIPKICCWKGSGNLPRGYPAPCRASGMYLIEKKSI